MIRSLSSREKWLAGLVGGVGFVFLTFALLDAAWKSHTRLRSELDRKTRQVKIARLMAADLTLWTERENWLHTVQPKLENSDAAGVQLLNRVTEVAKRHGILLENPALNTPERAPEFQSVAVLVETKSAWQPLIAFLRDLQQPDQFIAMESAELKIDASDATQMRGRFKIARWYAPQ